MNALAGGRLFPGEHHRAHFAVREGSESIEPLHTEEVYSSDFSDETR